MITSGWNINHVTGRRGRLTFWLTSAFWMIISSGTVLFEMIPFVKVVEKPFAVDRTSELMITVFTKRPYLDSMLSHELSTHPNILLLKFLIPVLRLFIVNGPFIYSVQAKTLHNFLTFHFPWPWNLLSWSQYKYVVKCKNYGIALYETTPVL